MSEGDLMDVLRHCTCVVTTRDLPPCPAHGPIPTAHYRQLAEAEVESLRDQLRGAVEAGDELARMLARSPGIDPMRSLVLQRWREAAHPTPNRGQ